MNAYLENYNYHMDSRVRAGQKRTGISDVDEKRMKAVLRFPNYDDDSGEYEIPMRIKFEVCGTCDGRGKHVNPSIDAGGISGEDFDRDPEFRRDYFDGQYDVQCYECKGERVVAVPDPQTDDEREAMKKYEAWMQEEADYQNQCARERAMGC